MPEPASLPADVRAAAIEAAAEAVHNLEYPVYSPTAHPDHNRWSWRGDGHLGENGETDWYDRYRTEAAAAVDAALPVLLEGLRPHCHTNDDYCPVCAGSCGGS